MCVYVRYTRVVGKWFWSAKRKFPIKYLSKSFAHSFMSASKYLTGKESQTFLSLHTHTHGNTQGNDTKAIERHADSVRASDGAKQNNQI